MIGYRDLYLCVCLGLMAACSGGSNSPTPPQPATLPAANDKLNSSDKVLNVYNWTDFIDSSVLTDFEKEFGIKINYDVYESSEMMEAKLLSGHTNYDLVVPSGAFFEREIKAGVYQKLNKGLLPNLHNLDPGAVDATAVLDPGNQYGVDYMWLVSVGLGYDVTKIKQRLENAPVNSWRLMFDPQVVAKLRDCGVSVLDSPVDVVGAALVYLGKDPNRASLADLKSAEDLLLTIRPFIHSVDSVHYYSDLANGESCLALGWAGDIAQARQRAMESGKDVTISYSIPQEGSVSAIDVLAIPADAPHPRNAHIFINYLLRPDVAAKNSARVTYASGVAGSFALVSEALRSDLGVFPSAESRARLIPERATSVEFDRALTRMWTRFKTGQ